MDVRMPKRYTIAQVHGHEECMPLALISTEGLAVCSHVSMARGNLGTHPQPRSSCLKRPVAPSLEVDEIADGREANSSEAQERGGLAAARQMLSSARRTHPHLAMARVCHKES